ncbi:MAG: hypothetical protein Q9164_007495 [Protoblastenia rupestris]
MVKQSLPGCQCRQRHRRRFYPVQLLRFQRHLLRSGDGVFATVPWTRRERASVNLVAWVEGRGLGSRNDRPGEVVARRDSFLWILKEDSDGVTGGPFKFASAEGCCFDVDQMVILCRVGDGDRERVMKMEGLRGGVKDEGFGSKRKGVCFGHSDSMCFLDAARVFSVGDFGGF